MSRPKYLVFLKRLFKKDKAIYFFNSKFYEVKTVEKFFFGKNKVIEWKLRRQIKVDKNSGHDFYSDPDFIATLNDPNFQSRIKEISDLINAYKTRIENLLQKRVSSPSNKLKSIIKDLAEIMLPRPRDNYSSQKRYVERLGSKSSEIYSLFNTYRYEKENLQKDFELGEIIEEYKTTIKEFKNELNEQFLNELLTGNFYREISYSRSFRAKINDKEIIPVLQLMQEKSFFNPQDEALELVSRLEEFKKIERFKMNFERRNDFFEERSGRDRSILTGPNK